MNWRKWEKYQLRLTFHVCQKFSSFQFISYIVKVVFLVLVPELEEALQLDNAEFESKYGFPKPPLDKPLVTHCMKGARAAKAQDILVAQAINK